jgi:TolA-binding protein
MIRRRPRREVCAAHIARTTVKLLQIRTAVLVAPSAASMDLLAAAKSPSDFQQVIDRYPGSQPASSAYLLLAEKQRAKKQYAEANTTLHKFIDQFPKHELITTAWMGVAANLDSLGKGDEALSTYQRLVAEYYEARK